MSKKKQRLPVIGHILLAKSNINLTFAPKPDDLKEFDYSINIQHEVNTAKQMVTLIFSVRISKKNAPTIIMGDFTIIYQFKVGEIQDALSPELSLTLNRISYSTARGIILMQTNGTPLQTALLPVIDDNDLK